jgi:hypothetical protein
MLGSENTDLAAAYVSGDQQSAYELWLTRGRLVELLSLKQLIVANLKKIVVLNLGTPKAAAKLEFLFNILNMASVIKSIQNFITLRPLLIKILKFKNMVQNFNFSLGLHFPVAVLSFLQNRFKRLVQCIRFL